jgi:hypothetical protein
MATRFPASATWLLMAGFYRIRLRVEMGAIVWRRFDVLRAGKLRAMLSEIWNTRSVIIGL